MKKILLISSKDYNYYNFRSEMILELVRLGYEVVLVCPPGDKIEFFIQRGCRFVGHEMDRRGTSIINDLKLLYCYYKIFREEKPDLVLAYTGKSSAYGGFVCRLLKIPCIINNAGLVDNSLYSPIVGIVLETFYRLGFRKAACMMYQNSQERNYINKVLDNKVHYRDIPGSGVNLNTFSFCEYPKDNTIVFNYVARVVRIKGINEYLECAERIHSKYPYTKFRIYGEYDEIEYEPRIKELESKGAVEYCGSKLDMKPHIASAHAVIHASYYEGMTNVILEHGAMGRPAITSDIPGCKEGVNDGETGYLFPVRNIDALVEAVEKFINLTHEQRAEMGIAARKKMEKEFDRTIVTNIYLEEIERIIGKA